MMPTSDLTCVYYTANTIPSNFGKTIMDNLQEVTDASVILSLLPANVEPSHFQIYWQALEGAKIATTKYVALCEDDVLYSPEHFKYRPRKAPFAYNLAYWGIYTWQNPSIYNYKGRRNLGLLICERDAFIEAMEERFAKYPDPQGQDLQDIWAEPGKYEDKLGVTKRETEAFYTQPPNIKFSHENELSFKGLGTRKRAGEMRALDIPYWGKAEDIRRLYE